MAQVRLSRISKDFDKQRVLDNINIDIKDEEFMVFVGPSGCGKTTLLRIIAGLERPTIGRVSIGTEDVTRAAPARRGVAMVFQSYALYPHMTVFDNIAFGLRVAKMPKEEIKRAVRETAGMLQIEHLLERKPAVLSGGQRQRVAIGRSIVRAPKVFLFDEPLSNLDAALRVQMRVELINLHRRLSATMVYVTHDQIEAMTLANRIAVLNQGRLEQLGSPLDIYHSPRNIFVAGFIGSPKMNFLDVRATEVDHTGITVGLPGNLPLKIPVSGDNVEPGSELRLGVRPEHLGLGQGVNGPADATMKAQASVVEHLGGEIFVHAKLTDQSSLVLTSAGYNEIAQSDQIDIGVRASLCHLFGADGTALSPITKRAVSA